MKEKEFAEKIERLGLTYLNLDLSVEVPVYFSFDDDGNVVLDEEEMKTEFENKLREVKEILN